MASVHAGRNIAILQEAGCWSFRMSEPCIVTGVATSWPFDLMRWKTQWLQWWRGGRISCRSPLTTIKSPSSPQEQSGPLRSMRFDSCSWLRPGCHVDCLASSFWVLWFHTTLCLLLQLIHNLIWMWQPETRLLSVSEAKSSFRVWVFHSSTGCNSASRHCLRDFWNDLFRHWMITRFLLIVNCNGTVAVYVWEQNTNNVLLFIIMTEYQQWTTNSLAGFSCFWNDGPFRLHHWQDHSRNICIVAINLPVVCSHFSSMVRALDALSDDEGCSGQPLVKLEAVCKLEKDPKSLKTPRTSGPGRQLSLQCVRPKLARVVQSVCRCAMKLKRTSNSCLRQFGDQLDDLSKLYLWLRKLDKEEMDEQASQILCKRWKETTNRPHSVCSQSVM